MQVGLADEHGAGLTKMRNRGCVAIGDVAVAHARRGGGWKTTHVEQILDGDGHAVERAAIASRGELAIGFTRLTARLVCRDQNERVQPWIVGLDTLQAVVRDLLAGELARAQPPPEVLDRDHVGEYWDGTVMASAMAAERHRRVR